MRRSVGSICRSSRATDRAVGHAVLRKNPASAGFFLAGCFWFGWVRVGREGRWRLAVWCSSGSGSPVRVPHCAARPPNRRNKQAPNPRPRQPQPRSASQPARCPAGEPQAAGRPNPQCRSRRFNRRSVGFFQAVMPATLNTAKPPSTTAGTSPNSFAIVPA